MGEKIGRGAFATVYKALWNETKFQVAIKRFDTSAMPKETIDSVLNEVGLLGRLKHPNVLRILGYHRDRENLFLMLEFAENGSLLKLVKELSCLPEHLVCMYIEQVLRALVYLHSQGVIHRDLKVCISFLCVYVSMFSKIK
jgi:serine/threonine protein kinase